MKLPFTAEQFFEVMARYNQTVWPAPVVLAALALAVCWAAWRRTNGAGRFVGAVLALLWAWMALAYHWAFFASVNPAAWWFGGLFLAGSVAFAW